MRSPAKEQLVIIGVAIRSLSESSKAPSVDLSGKRWEVGVIEKSRRNGLGELVRFNDAERAPMRHPCNCVCKFFGREDLMKLRREVAVGTSALLDGHWHHSHGRRSRHATCGGQLLSLIQGRLARGQARKVS
eukprot:scaffold3496_cov38-Attheya_sp.AAC.1